MKDRSAESAHPLGMARFYLHLNECGVILDDEEGVELADEAAARTAAVKAAREVMADEVKQGRLCLSCHIEVHDAHGLCIVRLPFRELLTVTGL